MPPTVRATDPDGFLAVADGLVAVYRSAFTPAPHHETEEHAAGWREKVPSHVRRDGFAGAIAEDDGRLVGFAYGYAGTADPWVEQLREVVAVEDRRRWLDDAFSVVELAVSADRQGEGIGGRLFEAILAGRTEATGVLQTLADDERARGFYERRGWSALLDGLTYGDAPTRWCVLVRDLA